MAMFCTNLRNRPELAAVVPLLIKSQAPRWTEKELGSHDISMPVPRSGNKILHAQLLLLSASDLQTMQDVTAKIERLYNLSGGRYCGIVFLVNEKDSRDNGSYFDLQAKLLSLSFEIPIILLPHISSLPNILSTYHRQLIQARSIIPPVNPVTSLLPYCSANPPLGEHTRNVLSDICYSLVDLASEATTDGGEKIRRWIGESDMRAEELIDFWLQEYVAE